MTFEWNYAEGHVAIPMPGETEEALQKFTRTAPSRPQHSPREWTAHEYFGVCMQYLATEDTSLSLDANGINRQQQFIGHPTLHWAH
jgi:hypothetical protein